MYQERTATLEEVHGGSRCAHYWLIETPSGPVSKGVCRLCGEQREFRNYLGDTRWDNDVFRESPLPGKSSPGELPAQEEE